MRLVYFTLLSTAQAFFHLTPRLTEEDFARIDDSLAKGNGIEGKRSIRSFHDTFLRVRDSIRKTTRVDFGQYRNACARWHIEDLGGKVTIKSYCSFGGFLRAHDNGKVSVSDRMVEEAMWSPFKNGDGSWSLMSAQGQWLSARLDGSVRTVEKRHIWERFWIDSLNKQ